MSEAKAILIAAASGRALAAAARLSGYRPRVVDFFDDDDTRALASATASIADPAQGFTDDDLISRLRELARGETPIGLVYGSGFEDRPEILAALAKEFLVFGNNAPNVARAKDPRELAALCRELDIPHPEIRFDLPGDPEHWLIKRQGGGGGIHIRPADAPLEAGDYYQRRVPGAPVSVLLLADGHSAQILGTSSQWTAESPNLPYRFGGAVRPALGANAQLAAMSEAGQKIVVALGLVGLNSVDFLAEANGFHLLEVNPRPGATLDIFMDRDGALFDAHLAACRGHLPRQPLVFTKAAATAIAYAPRELPSMPRLAWPDWCKDRQRPGTFLRAGDPVCTLSAEADTAAAARARVGERLALFDDYLLREAQKECAA
ncbi:MAG: ATP-grasp domain-containing protein [Methylovirgula sp.]|uniref:ATP-grasp domain-containing protein n=1 Tax=Methylovirgula sp. TaxID=1978224 RepID=UPI0030767D24